MRSLLTYLLLTMLVVLPTTGTLSESNGPEDVASAILREGMTNPRAFEMLTELTAIGPRLSGSENFEKSVQWAKSKMTALGFENVHLQPVQIPNWVRGKVAFAEATASNGKKIPLTICALGGSVPTPAGGVVAEVIEVRSFDELKNQPDKVKGKIVFFNRPMDPGLMNTFEAYGGASEQRNKGPVQAAAAGAVAAIVRSMTLAFDDVPHTGNTTYDPAIPKIPAAAVSTKDAESLSKFLKNEPGTRITLKLDCQQLPDVESANVIGEIRGSEFPEEIILIGGHLDSWDFGTGAHDDGAGCVHSLEALSILKRLGWKPKRTIRTVLFANEENGLRGARAYTDLVTKTGKHILCVETDAGGFSPRGFTISDKVTLEKIRQWGEALEISGAAELREGFAGADLIYLSKMGIPAMGLVMDSQRYFDYHHSAKDTLDKVNPRELELGAVALATLSYIVSENGL